MVFVFSRGFSRFFLSIAGSTQRPSLSPFLPPVPPPPLSPRPSSHLQRLPLPVEQELQRHELVDCVRVLGASLRQGPLVAEPQRLGPEPPLCDLGARGVERRQRVEERRVLDPRVLAPPAAHLARQAVRVVVLSVPRARHQGFGCFREQRGLGRGGRRVVDALGPPAPADAAAGAPRQAPQGLRGVLGPDEPVPDERVRAQEQRRAAERVPPHVGRPERRLGRHERQDLPGADARGGQEVDEGEGLGAQVPNAVRPRQRRRVEDDARPAARGRGAGDVGVGGVERGAGGQHGAHGGRGRGQRRRGHSDASPDRMEAGCFLRRLGGSRQFNGTSADRGNCARPRTAAAAEGGRRSREGRTRSEQHRVENAKKKLVPPLFWTTTKKKGPAPGCSPCLSFLSLDLI